MFYRPALLVALVFALAGAANANVITSTPGLLYYVDASIGVTSSGGLVSAWADQSGNGNNFAGAVGSQPTLTSVPGQFNNLPVIHFDGSTTLLTMPNSTTPGTVFIVGDTTQSADYLGGIWGQAVADQGIRLDVMGTPAGTSPLWRATSSGNSNGNDFPTTLTINNVNTSAGGVGKPFVMEATGSLGSFNATALGNYFNAGGRFWGGNIAAVAVYSGTLTTAEQQAIITSLGNQFGIVTPEPNTLVLALLGGAGLLVCARRRRQAGRVAAKG